MRSLGRPAVYWVADPIGLTRSPPYARPYRNRPDWPTARVGGKPGVCQFIEESIAHEDKQIPDLIANHQSLLGFARTIRIVRPVQQIRDVRKCPIGAEETEGRRNLRHELKAKFDYTCKEIAQRDGLHPGRVPRNAPPLGRTRPCAVRAALKLDFRTFSAVLDDVRRTDQHSDLTTLDQTQKLEVPDHSDTLSRDVRPMR